MPITDNRILIDAADAVTNFVDSIGGTMNLIADPARIEGSNAVALVVSTARDGILYDAGSPQDWSQNVFYIWWNVTTSQLLSAQSVGGVTIRFCGATITDWFEVFVAGSDTYSGGWVMQVIDVDAARNLAVTASPATDGAQNGTPPATSAIQYVGIVADIPAMSKGVENVFLDALWRLPKGDPGIIVSGDNTGVPWTWDDIVDAGDIGDTAKAWGTITKNDGIIKLNTPLQFGNNGSPDDGDHDFEDTLVVGAWENQLVDDGFYGFTFVGDSVNTQRLVAGVSGSAGQGWTFIAEQPDGPRWFIEATDAEIDNVGLYGCRFDHTTVIDIDNVFVDMFDSLLIDGQRLWHSRLTSPYGGADFQRNAIINADPIAFDESPIIGSPANVAYMWATDLERIIDNTFGYFSGHAIKALAADTFAFVGNFFDGPWNANGSPDGQQTLEAAIFNDVGNVILSVSGGGDSPTSFDTNSPGTTVNNDINVTLTGIEPGTEIRVYPVESPIQTTEIAGIENTGSPGEFSFSGAAGLVVDIVVLNIDYVLPPSNRIRNFTIPTSDSSFPISQIIDRNYLNL